MTTTRLARLGRVNFAEFTLSLTRFFANAQNDRRRAQRDNHVLSIFARGGLALSKYHPHVTLIYEDL